MSRALLLLLGAGLLGCGPADAPQPPAESDPIVRLEGRTMGTTWRVLLADPGSQTQEEIRAEIEAELEAVNREMSTWRPDSELSRFNASQAEGWFPVSATTAATSSLAQTVAAKTGGAYDVTLAPLLRLWGFGPGAPKGAPEPDDEAIAAVRPHIGHERFEVRDDPPALRKSAPKLEVDLSSIAKGHGVDRLATRLEQSGHPSWFVEIGGEVRVRGLKHDGSPWRVGIEEPAAARTDPQVANRIFATRAADHGFAVATSGNYRNYRERWGKRIGHVIDPRAGKPRPNPLASVSVLADDCMSADAWATALLASGMPAAREIAAREGLAALFIIAVEGDFRSESSAALEALDF